MALTIGLIVGASAFYGIRKIYQRSPKNKGRLMTVLLSEQDKKRDLTTTDTRAASSLFSDGIQEHQFRTISSERKTDGLSEAEREVNHYLAVSATSLALTIAGSLFFAPLAFLSIPGLVYVYAPWFKDAYHSIVREGRIRMVVVDVIFVTGMLATGLLLPSAIIATFIISSKKLLMMAEDRSKEKFLDIFSGQPQSLWILKDGIEIKIPIEQLTTGDRIVVHAGETVAVDGLIVQGHASIDQRILTGESQPVEKGPDDLVFALTIVLSGQIVIEATKAGQETVAAQIGTILNQTADYRRSIQWEWLEFVDKLALPTLVAGVVALPLVGAVGALGILLAFGFPYCMRVVAPITLLNFLNIASKNSILMKDGRSFELLSRVDTIVFDKTGTLTQEQPSVGNIYVLEPVHDHLSPDDLLMYAAAAEYKQSHPIARAIRQEASHRGLQCPEIEEAKYEIGYGIRVNIGQKSVWVGSVRFMELEQFTIPTQIEVIQNHCYEQGYSLVCVAIDNCIVGAIELHPTLRPEAQELVSYLKGQNMSLYILSGDHEKPTQKLASQLGIENYFAEILPENKAQMIENLQCEGKFVCFVGDGINDSIALKTANVSISLRGASTIATDTAQIVLMDESLQQLDELFDLAQQYNKTMDRGVKLMLVPNMIGVGGILFLRFGLLTVTGLYYAGMAVGLGNTALSTLNEQRKIGLGIESNLAGPQSWNGSEKVDKEKRENTIKERKGENDQNVYP